MLEQHATHRAAILCLAITPAVQRTQRLAALRPGEVNRIRRTILTASGKGINVALALKHLGGRPLLLGFAGGDGGRYVAADMQRLGIEARWIETAAPTRHCHTLLDAATGEVTELVEEATPPSAAEWAAFHEALLAALPGCVWLAISGALPPGAPAGALAAICRAANEASVPLCVDSQGEPLRQCLAARPAIVKLNTEELARTCGLTAPSPTQLDDAARSLLDAGAGAVLVTDGPHPALLATARSIERLAIPAVRVVNPIGSGDSVTAGLLHGLRQGLPLPDAARLGLACGSANAETETPADFTAARAADLLH